ncbi:MAG: hypothetical protein AB4063_14705 [Crocosphaera sp.]
MNDIKQLVDRLMSCPAGKTGWEDFEDICIEILEYLFVPPLSKPKVQARTLSGVDRRDAVFPNRNFNNSNIWGQLLQELNARMIVFEFKNYDASSIGKEEVNQISNYLTEPIGRLGIIICSKQPDKSAYIKRNTIYSQSKKIIVFLTKEHLEEMIYIKERGDDPADLIMDLLEWFYLEYE